MTKNGIGGQIKGLAKTNAITDQNLVINIIGLGIKNCDHLPPVTTIETSVKKTNVMVFPILKGNGKRMFFQLCGAIQVIRQQEHAVVTVVPLSPIDLTDFVEQSLGIPFKLSSVGVTRY